MTRLKSMFHLACRYFFTSKFFFSYFCFVQKKIFFRVVLMVGRHQATVSSVHKCSKSLELFWRWPFLKFLLCRNNNTTISLIIKIFFFLIVSFAHCLAPRFPLLLYLMRLFQASRQRILNDHLNWLFSTF